MPPIDFDALVAELRAVRESGPAQLRRIPLPLLTGLAKSLPSGRAGAEGASRVEALLGLAVRALGPGRLGDAAAYTFGLVPGTRDWAAYDRRRRAAEIYRVGVDRFRKHYERILLEETAGAIIGLAGSPPGDDRTSPGPAAPGTPTDGLGSAWSTSVRFGGHPVPVVVHHRSIELMTGVDILVSPENTYFAVAPMFKFSVSAALRGRAASRGANGDVTDDIVHRELAAQVSPGLAVPPGTVVVTSGGVLRQQGVRRIYHVAVTSPRAGTNEYDVDPATVGLAVSNVFRRAREENANLTSPLTSICFPVIGSGRGGLDPMVSLTWIWASLENELSRDGPWRIHLVTRDADLRRAVVARIAAVDPPGNDRGEPAPLSGTYGVPPGHLPSS